MKEKKDKIKYSVFNKSDFLLPVYFDNLTEVFKNSDKVVKIQIVSSDFHQTNLHIPYSFYKPICRITDER